MYVGSAMDTLQFEGRKRDHIRHALDPVHQAQGLTGLDRVHLNHEALPDLNFDEVQLDTPCLGRPLKTPFFVAGMTAGHADAASVNRTLAQACAERGWAMGVGSQRRELEELDGGRLDRWTELRADAPKLVLFANVGISQLIETPMERVAALVDAVSAQALAVHLNPLQEALQTEGTPRFRGAMAALERATRELPVPVVLKETGCGFSRTTLERIASSGIRLGAIDVSGLGGTHWGRIEGTRAGRGSIQGEASVTFGDWGESTVDSVLAAKSILTKTEVWATGGVRSGLDAAKLIALGAHRVGYAKPALEAALAGPEVLRRWMEIQEYELKVALFCTGTRTPGEMRGKERVWKEKEI